MQRTVVPVRVIVFLLLLLTRCATTKRNRARHSYMYIKCRPIR